MSRRVESAREALMAVQFYLVCALLALGLGLYLPLLLLGAVIFGGLAWFVAHGELRGWGDR